MRLATILFALNFTASVSLAVNIPLFAKDPMSIHRRDAIPQPEEQPAASVQDEDEEICAQACGMQRIEGVKSEREALCSAQGLRITLECAQCIDNTWPETTPEDSAMAEYERIVAACEDSPQHVLRSDQRSRKTR